MTHPVLNRYKVHLATGDTLDIASPVIVAVEGGALKIFDAAGHKVVWYSPSAWTSMDIEPDNG